MNIKQMMAAAMAQVAGERWVKPVRERVRFHSKDATLCNLDAFIKRNRKNLIRLRTWTGVRYDTPRVPSTVIK